jgi:hypothetical protein
MKSGSPCHSVSESEIGFVVVCRTNSVNALNLLNEFASAMIRLYPRIYPAAQSALSPVFAMMNPWQHLGKCISEQEVQSWLF